MTTEYEEQKYEYKKLRVSRYGGGVDVVGFQTVTSGVLEGQVVKCFIDNYENEAAAKAAHPDVEGYSNKWSDPTPSLSHLPDENTPVAGGMYPDDI